MLNARGHRACIGGGVALRRQGRSLLASQLRLFPDSAEQEPSWSATLVGLRLQRECVPGRPPGVQALSGAHRNRPDREPASSRRDGCREIGLSRALPRARGVGQKLPALDLHQPYAWTRQSRDSRDMTMPAPHHGFRHRRR